MFVVNTTRDTDDTDDTDNTDAAVFIQARSIFGGLSMPLP